MVYGERQFDAARAAADHDDFLRTTRVLDKGEPALAELGDRLDRHRMLGRAGDGIEIGRRADIEREQVIGERRLALQQHQPARAIESDRLGVDQPHAGPGAERREVDVALVEAVAAGDEAREPEGHHRGPQDPDERQPV